MLVKAQSQQTNSIRSIGYQLTSPLTISLPAATQSTSIFSSFLSILTASSNKPNILNSNTGKNAYILNDKTFIITRSNKLALFHYIVVQNRLQVEPRSCILLNQEIGLFACTSQQWFQRIQNCNYAIAHLTKTNTLVLIHIDLHGKAIEVSQLKLQDKLLAFCFVSQKKIALVLGDRVAFWAIRGKNLVQVEYVKINISQKEILKASQICIEATHPYKFYVFLAVANEKRSKLNLLEFARQDHLKLIFTYNDVFEKSLPQQMLNKLDIYAFSTAFFVKTGKSLWVLQKKFAKYLCTDAVSEFNKFFQLSVILHQNNLFLCTIGETEIELWEVILKDVGCRCKLLDVIEADGQKLAPKLLKNWIFCGEKAELAFLVNLEGKQFQFYLTQKGDKLRKLVDRVKKVEETRVNDLDGKKQFRARVKQVEQLGERLGFKRKQFYLSLWQGSEKNSRHIYQFLLPSLDFKVIFEQLNLYLRAKTLKVCELIRILKTIQVSIKDQLCHKLSIELIEQYLKCNFQRRKLKLYSSQQPVDNSKFIKIYKMSLIDLIQRSIDLQLYPQKFHHDILWKEQEIESPLQIGKILRQFRLTILENYPQFLLQVLEPYQNSLAHIVQHFYYLLPQYPLKISLIRQELVKLSNIYPEAKIEEKQHFWLGYISQSEWYGQKSSLHSLMKYLYAHYPTSQINDKLKEFIESPRVSAKKNKQYMFISCTRQAFQNSLPSICDATTVLYLCEKANRIAIQAGTQSQSEAILKLMVDKNNLPLAEFNRFIMLSRLHILLIKQKLIDRNFGLIQLKSIQDYKLVQFFFLGERSKIKLLFEEVSIIFPNQSQFNRVIAKFAASQQCSKIELQILLCYFKTMKEEKISNNQQLLSIVIDGFLSRIQIREKDKAIQFLKLMRDVPLSGDLLIKLSIFQSIKNECYLVLLELGMEQLSYLTLISQLDVVIQTLVNNYFQELAGKKVSVCIQGRQISLIYPRNLFAIVLYLKDKLYSFRKDEETFLSFCFALVGWNQFQLISECFGNGVIIDGEQISAQQFYYMLVSNLLEKYGQNEDLLYDDDTKQNINQLLHFLPRTCSLKISERAKIAFSQLLQSFGFKLTVKYMHELKDKWSIGKTQRIQLFKQITDGFIDMTDFQTMKEFYRLLEVVRLGTEEIEIKSDEMVQLAQYICQKLIFKQKYIEICQIIYFLNANQRQFKVNTWLMNECFLQILIIKQKQTKLEIESFKPIIDYYLSQKQNTMLINELFLHKFKYLQFDQRYITQDIQILDELSYDNNDFRISRHEIWNFLLTTFRLQKYKVKQAAAESSLSRLTSRSKSVKIQNLPPLDNINYIDNGQFLYVYFFLCKLLSKPDFLLDFNQVSFNHGKNIIALQFMLKNSRYQSNLKFMVIFLNYLRGLYRIYYNNLIKEMKMKINDKGDFTQLINQVGEMESKIQVIKSIEEQKMLFLIADIEKTPLNIHIYIPMKKLATLLTMLIDQRKKQHNLIFSKVCQMGLQISKLGQTNKKTVDFKDLTDLKQSRNRQQLGQHKKKKTFKFSEFQKLKKNYTVKSNITNERQIIQKVMEDLQFASSFGREANGSQLNSIKKIHYEEKDSRDDFGYESVLGDLNLEEESKHNQTQFNNLLTDIDVQCDEQVLQELCHLIANKQYKKIQENFKTKIILRAINQYFYDTLELKSISKPSGINMVVSKKRLGRANTIDTFDQSENKLFQLLEILEHLKVSENSSKIRLLRQSLVLISSQDLVLLQGHLLCVFRLNILLNPSRNPKIILFNMVQNLKELNNLHLDSFEAMTKVAEFFLSRCKDEGRTFFGDSNTEREKQEYEINVGLLYKQYWIKLMSSTKSFDEKHSQMVKIIKILGRDKLAEIHNQITESIKEEELLENYILDVYEMFGCVQ